MNNLLDRTYQLEILKKLASVYPAPFHNWETVNWSSQDEERRFCANMIYLEQHGLINSGIKFSLDGEPILSPSRINHRGMDFLADDGGLSAILGTVTVRIHADTIRDLLDKKIESALIPPAEKSALISHLKKLPEIALAEITKKLVAAGLDSLPDVLQLLRTTAAF